MVFSIINFIFNDHFPFPNGPEGAFVHLGLPQYFKMEFTTAKILGVLALLIPNVPFKTKEFARSLRAGRCKAQRLVHHRPVVFSQSVDRVVLLFRKKSFHPSGGKDMRDAGDDVAGIRGQGVPKGSR